MISYRKLEGGVWGVQSPTECQPGQPVEVHTRAGAIRHETIAALHSTIARGGGFVYTVAPRNAAAPRQTSAVGDLSGVLALFQRARAHLRRPKIEIGIAGLSIRLTVAGARARVPGSLNVTSKDQYGESIWYGRILSDGRFEASPRVPTPADLVEGLRDFARDPARVAADHGRLHGVCCFCNIPLRDERSTAMGYGPICAEHFGLPWGHERHEFACEATAPIAAVAASARQVMYQSRIDQ